MTVIVKLVNKTLKKAAKNHAIVIGHNFNIAQLKEQFLWNLAFHHCLHLQAKLVFTFKTRFLFNGQKRLKQLAAHCSQNEFWYLKS
jgi:hypothetical protein